MTSVSNMNIYKMVVKLSSLVVVIGLSANVSAQDAVKQKLNPYDIIGKWSCRFKDEKLGTQFTSFENYSKNGILTSNGEVDLNYNATVVHYKISSKQKWLIDGDLLKWENLALSSFETSHPKLEELINYKSNMNPGITGVAKIVELSANHLKLQYLITGLPEIAPVSCTR